MEDIAGVYLFSISQIFEESNSRVDWIYSGVIKEFIEVIQ